jgi:phage shock protein A
MKTLTKEEQIQVDQAIERAIKAMVKSGTNLAKIVETFKQANQKLDSLNHAQKRAA